MISGCATPRVYPPTPDPQIESFRVRTVRPEILRKRCDDVANLTRQSVAGMNSACHVGSMSAATQLIEGELAGHVDERSETLWLKMVGDRHCLAHSVPVLEDARVSESFGHLGHSLDVRIGEGFELFERDDE